VLDPVKIMIHSALVSDCLADVDDTLVPGQMNLTRKHQPSCRQAYLPLRTWRITLPRAAHQLPSPRACLTVQRKTALHFVRGRGTEVIDAHCMPCKGSEKVTDAGCSITPCQPPGAWTRWFPCLPGSFPERIHGRMLGAGQESPGCNVSSTAKDDRFDRAIRHSRTRSAPPANGMASQVVARSFPHCAQSENPPSIGNAIPVTNAASSDTR
jgi:hypothetical protein